MKLVLSDALAHGSGARDAAGDHLLELVDVSGAAPLLVLDDVDAELDHDNNDHDGGGFSIDALPYNVLETEVNNGSGRGRVPITF